MILFFFAEQKMVVYAQLKISVNSRKSLEITRKKIPYNPRHLEKAIKKEGHAILFISILGRIIFYLLSV